MSETLERPVSRLPAPIRALRPRQWVKNFLVVLAPLAAGWLFRPEVLRGVALAFVAFCLVSSAVYLLNDIRDVEEDRLHPRKRFRPDRGRRAERAGGRGDGDRPRAWAVWPSGTWSTPALAITLGVYVVIQILYSTVLKHLPVIDLAVVSSGFLLRAIAGGVAVGVPLSQWFLLVASFGSLFMVAGQALLRAGLGRRRGRHPQVAGPLLGLVPAVRLDPGRRAGGHGYSLWAFENRYNPPLGVPWTAISIAPFTLGMLQYALEVDAGQAGEPEDVVLHDHVLQGLGVIWLATISIAVFA